MTSSKKFQVSLDPEIAEELRKLYPLAPVAAIVKKACEDLLKKDQHNLSI